MFNNFKNRENKFHPLKILFFALIFIAIMIAISYLVMYLWNHILVDTTGVKPLTFWKAAGLLLLAKILFGGFGRRNKGKRHFKNGPWKEKWMGMSSTERSEAKARWKEYCRQKRDESLNEE